MRHEVTMPRMGQSMEEGQVLNWLKRVGDDVKRGEVIAEIETDKAAVEMESFYDGTLTEIVVPEGETVPVGTVIAIVENERPVPDAARGERQEEGIKSQEPARGGRIPATPIARRLADKHDIDLAQVEGSGPGGRVGREDVQRRIDEHEVRGEAITESRPIKASPAAKRLGQQRGADLRQIEGTGPGDSITKEDVETWLRAQEETEPATRVAARRKVSPAARRLAEERGVDLAKVEATGPQGSVSVEDVAAWLDEQTEPAPEPEAVTRVALSRIKRTIAQRMTESKATVPHFYVAMDIDMQQALALRQSLDARGYQVSVNDLVLRATVLALLEHPHLNATFANDEIYIHPDIDLAVAVALEEGLITPVVHDCQDLSLTQLAGQVREVVDRARSGRLRADDLDVGTFTVTNLGMFGVRQFEAIVNPPQAAILAVGQVRRVPAFDVLDRVVAQQVLTATVSADHRVTDGAEVARFMRDLREILEDGFRLLESA